MDRSDQRVERRLVLAAAEILSPLHETASQACMARLLLRASRQLVRETGLPAQALEGLRLVHLVGAPPARALNGEDELWGELSHWLGARGGSGWQARLAAAHRIGQALDLLMAAASGDARKRAGSYFTPRKVAADLVHRAASALHRTLDASSPCAVLDPACGGGAFLLEAAVLLASSDEGARAVPSMEERLGAAVVGLHGIDRSELAIAVTEVALTLLAGRSVFDLPSRLVVGDALLAADATDVEARELIVDWAGAFPERLTPGSAPGDSVRGFDWIVGNPPWVAFQGRATKRISPELRAYYRAHYEAFSGYATLHGMFVEQAARLAPHGVVSLLLPSSVSDLDGYRASRRCIARSHVLQEPFQEYGQDAFAGVVQPCFGLVARPPGEGETTPTRNAERPFRLEERTHGKNPARSVSPPEVLGRLGQWARLPDKTFRELGFQSNTAVVNELFQRGDEPEARFTQPLLEGRRVRPFIALSPQLHFDPNPMRLQRLGARFRGPEPYQEVDFLIRQTAAYPIVAPSPGLPFRNSLIAGYAIGAETALLVALLNSALFRALHLSLTRDARQAAFPQVKLAHLRALPAPPRPTPEGQERELIALSRGASGRGTMRQDERRRLDELVFSLFGLSATESQEVTSFLRARAPRALE